MNKSLIKCPDCGYTYLAKPDEKVCRYCYYWGNNPEAQLRRERVRGGGESK